MEKKNIIFLTVIAVATLLTAVVGTTFAYFTATITGNDTATTTTVTTATLGIIFTDSNSITGTAISPGWTSSKTFSIENNSEVSMTYIISWTGVNNTFLNEGDVGYDGYDLKYSLSTTDETTDPKRTITDVPAPRTNGDFTQSITIAPHETHHYTLTMNFYNDENRVQDSQQGKSFSGVLHVEGASIG